MRFMKGRHLFGRVAPLMLAAVVLGCGAAHTESPTPDPRGVLPLWEVTDGTNTVHLLGSIHLLRPEAYPLDPAIYRVFDAADVVAFELDFAEVAEAGLAMMQRGMLEGGQTIAEVLPDDLLEELERRATELQLPVAMVHAMKPWLTSLTLSTLFLQQAGFDAAAGVDMHFHERAAGTGKRIIGLETIDDQLDALDGLSDDAQTALLRSTLAELDSSAVMLDKTTALWQRGDAEALAAMNTESMRGQPELVERLLDQRNRRWVPQIESLLRGGEPAMVIVGVAHLVGEGSVVELLRERGYRITRVQASTEMADAA